jgi:hypothetical protein
VTNVGVVGAQSPVIRGYPTRLTDFQEKLQWGYINAVAAAAGCILAQPEIDDGVDVIARHQASIHTDRPDSTARLEIQLKATSSYVNSKSAGVSAQLSQERWQYFRAQEAALGKIVVILSMPSSQADWVEASHNAFNINHCAYWVNVSSLPATTAANPTVTAPKSQIFDDQALCHIMARLGQGLAP